MQRAVQTIIAMTLTMMSIVLVQAETARWQKTIDKVTPSVVSIQVEVPRAFETSKPMTSQGTGFVIDAKRGIILTNRHIVQPGPVTATATFINQEEVELKPIYRDPVHDFGFFQYDPKALRHLKVRSLELRPNLAEVGVEIRVIGNDAGEKLSILDGTLARLNRDAPAYGRFQYNDFNTFYIQAASGATGGSSGSPVINKEGQVVALQAGGSFSANTNMFFPLDRIKHAYEFLREGEKVARGTFQTTFKYRSYAELRRLGLTETQENKLRKHKPDGQGALVVDHLLPGGPVDGILQPGDILYRLDNRLVSRFIPLEDYLDRHVNQRISITYIRGGKEYSNAVMVDDLAAITPSDYLEIGRAVLHDNSYQQARHLNKPIKGVVVATAGYMFGNSGISSGAVITSIDETPIDDLQDAIAVLEKIPNNKEFPVRFYGLREPHNDSISIVQNQRNWHEANYCDADIESGLWRCRPIAKAPPEETKPVQTAHYAKQSNPLADEVAPSLVWVNFSTPYPIDEIGRGRSFGTGLVIDAKNGLIAVDRTTVPSALGEINLTFAGSVQIPAEVAFIHPLHNLALLHYDPKLLGDTLVRSVTLAEQAPKEGERVDIVGTNYNYQVLVQNRQVSTYSPLSVNPSGTPKFTDANLMVIATDTSYSHSSGAFLNPKGEVSAMIISYGSGRNERKFWAISVQHLKDMLALYESGVERVYSLEVEWGLVSFVAARRLGMPEEWLQRISNEKPEDHQVLAVNNTWKGTAVSEKLLSGDILLAVDDQLLTSFREVEMATQKDSVKLTIARSGEVLNLEVEPTSLSTHGTDRVLLWAGANLQEPHRAIRTQLGITEPGVYVSRQNYGSPAQHFGIRGQIITAVDDKPTPNLDAFIAAVKYKQDRESVRLKVLSLSGREQVITLTLSNNYWPMAEIRKVAGRWQRISIPINVGE